MMELPKYFYFRLHPSEKGTAVEIEDASDVDVVEIIRCKDCKHNPKYEWFGCPMSHLSEAQRPETAWCWRAERRTDE